MLLGALFTVSMLPGLLSFSATSLQDPGQVLEASHALDPGARRAHVYRAVRAAGATVDERLAWCAAYRAAALGETEELRSYGYEFAHRELSDAGRVVEALAFTEGWLAESSGWERRDLEGDAHAARAISLYGVGRFDEASDSVETALGLYGPEERSVRVGNALTLAGGIAFRQGRYARATELHDQALRLGEELGNKRLQTLSWNNLGVGYKNLDSPEEARAAYEMAFALAEEQGDEATQMEILGNLAGVYRELGELELALEASRTALAYNEEAGKRANVVSDQTAVGLTLAAMGEVDEAVSVLSEAIEARRDLGLQGSLALSLFTLGQLCLQNGREAEALDVLEQARDELGPTPGVLERDVFEALVEAQLANGRFEEAAESFARFLELERDLTHDDLEERNAELQVRMGIAREQSELERLRAQEHIDRLQIDQQRTKIAGLIVGCVLLALTCGTLVLFVRLRSRLSRSLEERNEQLASAMVELEATLQRSRESEARYRSLFGDGAVGRLVVDPASGAVLETNEVANAWLTQAGFQRSVYELSPALSLDHSQATLWNVSTEDGPRQIEVTTLPIVLEQRDVELVTLRDVTDARLLEEEQNRSQMLGSLGLLAAGIGHDFNNALTAILGSISTARASQDPREADVFLRRAENAAAQAGQMTDQLLAFARGGEPNLAIADLAPQLESWAHFSCSGSGVELELDLQADLWPARYDEGQLSQVLYNLVLNAKQAMENRGRLRITARKRRVREGGDGGARELAPGPYLWIEVRDSGPGVPPELREKIFEPYFSTKGDTRGLGLATSYSVLRRHGGLLRLAQRTDGGATFEIFVPAVPDAVLPVPPVDTVPHGEGRVLVVDDQESVRTVFRSMLERLGYDVTTVTDGEEGVRVLLDGGPFDLAVIDATIPGGLGGQVALEALREQQPNLRAVLTSGYAKEGLLAQYGELGFDEALRKPFRFRALASIVDGVLKKEDDQGSASQGEPSSSRSSPEA